VHGEIIQERNSRAGLRLPGLPLADRPSGPRTAQETFEKYL